MESSSSRRIQALSRQLSGSDEATGLSSLPCAAPVRSLPRFDTLAMESYMDDLRSLKVATQISRWHEHLCLLHQAFHSVSLRQVEVYELFRQHPELLDVVEEGMTKGGWCCCVAVGGPVLRPCSFRPNMCRLPAPSQSSTASSCGSA